MNNKARKVISVLLVLCMMFSIFPTAAFAQVDSNEVKDFIVENHGAMISGAWDAANDYGLVDAADEALNVAVALLAEAKAVAGTNEEGLAAIKEAEEAVAAAQAILDTQNATSVAALVAALTEVAEAVEAVGVYVEEDHPDMINEAWTKAEEAGLVDAADASLNVLADELFKVATAIYAAEEIPADVKEEALEAFANADMAIDAVQKILEDQNSTTPEQLLAAMGNLAETATDVHDVLVLVAQYADEELQAVIAEAMAAIEAALQQVEEALYALNDAIEEALYELNDAIHEQLFALNAELMAMVADLEAAVADAIAQMQAEYAEAIYNATHGEIACNAKTIAVYGGDTVAAEGGYADIVAEAWGLTEGSLADADVILYQVDPQIFVNALLETVNGEYEAAWETFITDDEVLAVLEQVKAEVVAKLAAEYGEETVAIVEPLVDSLLYAVVEYAVANVETVEGIKEVNADALIVAVGMYNPLQDLTVTINGEVIDVEALCDYLIDATVAYNQVYAFVSQDVVFVDVCEADAQAVGNVDVDAVLALKAEALELLAAAQKALEENDMDAVAALTAQATALMEQAEAGIGALLAVVENLGANYATEEGHAYMAEQILAAVTVADHELGDWAFDKANHWKECAICGESFDKDAHAYSGSKDKTCDVCGYERKVSSGGGGAAMPVKPAVKGQDAFMSGYPNGTFGPDKQITRGEVAAMFARLMADKAVAGKVYTNDFTDVPASLWSANAIGFMQEQGVVKGYTDGTFRPEQPITRAEFVAMASRFEAATGTALVTFTDVPANHWAANVIKAAAAAGWVGGYEDGTFRPDNNITRAEATAVMCNVLDIEANVDYIAANVASLKNFSDVTKAHWAYWDIMAATNGNACVK